MKIVLALYYGEMENNFKMKTFGQAISFLSLLFTLKFNRLFSL